MRGFCLPHAKFSLQYVKFSLRYTMRNMFGMFSFEFWVMKALKCEVVNFLKFKLAGRPVRPFKYLGMPILLIACAPCMCTCDMHAHCDVTRFAHDANHITMTSPAFTFHSCYVGMRWHDIICVHIGGASYHHGLHCMGMTLA